MRAILTFHSIDASESVISVTPEAFRTHVDWLASGRVRVVPLRELVTLPDDADAVALTFDDGFANFATDAAPLLFERGLPATLFVVSDCVGATNEWRGKHRRGIPALPLLDWDDLGRLAERGVEIGAHTRRHPHLTRVRGAALDDEVAGCAHRIAERIGVRPTSFAYPYGSVDAPAADVVRKTFELACTTELRQLAPTDDRALLPRLDMFYFRNPHGLSVWGTATFRRRLWVRAQARRMRSYVTSARATR
jgi:peptidoglycan/xylan/chitin deacetylase (PgdA/CDA1 family)